MVCCCLRSYKNYPLRTIVAAKHSIVLVLVICKINNGYNLSDYSKNSSNYRCIINYSMSVVQDLRSRKTFVRTAAVSAL